MTSFALLEYDLAVFDVGSKSNARIAAEASKYGNVESQQHGELGMICDPLHQASPIINPAHFHPIMIDGALVLPVVIVGMIDASAIRRPWTP